MHTSYAARPIEDVKSDISIYATWPQSGIHVSGIFLDESTQSLDNLTYMADLYSTIKATSFTSNTSASNRGKKRASTSSTSTPRKPASQIWTNPGTPVDNAFYRYADTVTAYEGPYSDYQAVASEISASQMNKSCLMFLDWPESKSQINDAVQGFSNRGVRSGFVYGNGDDYAKFSTTWALFAKDVASL